MKVLQTYLMHMISAISPKELFQNKVNIYFMPSINTCQCGSGLLIYKTKIRRIATLLTGECIAHVTESHCKKCKIIYSSDELKLIAPKNSHFGFDIIFYIGVELFVNYRNDEQILKDLQEKNISISLREISHLGKCFIIYLALTHKSCEKNIKEFMNERGGYILHLDGTCEGRSPLLFSFIDEISSIVLGNIKISSENSKQIKPALVEIKKSYGNPIALVHDMSPAIAKAVESVFPDVRDFICHLHFLRDLGKDLFSVEYDFIRDCLKTYKVRTDLQKMAREFKSYIENSDDLKICLINCMEKNYFDRSIGSLMPPVAFYVLITWILESRNKSHGHGFPFDRPHVDFYDRLQQSHAMLEHLKNTMSNDSPNISLVVLNRTLNDISLKYTVTLIKERTALFDDLRDAMRIVSPENKKGLNDNGDDVNIKTIEGGVRAFRDSELVIKLSKTDIRYHKMIKQIDKYWSKLFSDPIEVKTDAGVVLIHPQRTNNMLEQFFRTIKSGNRKKSGTSSLTKTLTTMLANTPLVKNLKIPEYVEIILEGKMNLAERFAEIDIATVRAALQEEDIASRKHPKGMAKILRMEDFPRKIDRCILRKSG